MILDLKKLQKKYNLNIRGMIHIGAHKGEEYKVYKDMGIKNLLFFEPIPECFKELKKNVEGTVVNKALGNYTGKAKMFLASNGQSSSLLEPRLHKTQYPNISFKETIEVDIVRLDDVLENRERYNFISIDVQGYELEVFRGSIDTLRNINYIISEVNRDELYWGCARVNELDHFLRDFSFVRVETKWVGKTWGDAFYIKT